MEAPAPSPEMVAASRRHLTERHASGVDRLLWDTEKRFLPDLDAIKLVNDAAAAGQAEALDLGAALILVHASRLQLDRLEYELFESAHAAGMQPEAIAAVLELPDAAAVSQRQQWLKARRALPYTEAGPARPGGPGSSAEAAARAGRRTGRTAERASQGAALGENTAW